MILNLNFDILSIRLNFQLILNSINLYFIFHINILNSITNKIMWYKMRRRVYYLLFGWKEKESKIMDNTCLGRNFCTLSLSLISFCFRVTFYSLRLDEWYLCNYCALWNVARYVNGSFRTLTHWVKWQTGHYAIHLNLVTLDELQIDFATSYTIAKAVVGIFLSNLR